MSPAPNRVGGRWGTCRGLLSPSERKNGWQVAEAAGATTPYGMQHLLGRAVWDADAVRDELRAYVVEHLGDPAAVLVVDETGFLKQGDKAVGVQRQSSGTAGRIENCQLGVFLAYATPQGHAFLDRDLYLPEDWANDAARRAAAGVPVARECRTKPELARALLERARGDGVPAGWVTGDEVDGGDRRLRVWLEERGVAHVLAVKRTEPLWAATDRGPAQVKAEALAAALPAGAWRRLSAGDGAKGPRRYDWTRVAIRPLADPDRGYWLLVRRSLADPAVLAYYVCDGPATATLADLVAGGGGAVGDRGGAGGGQRGGGGGPLPGAALGRLVPPRHPLPAGPCLPGRDPRAGERLHCPRWTGGSPRLGAAWRRSGPGAASGAVERGGDPAAALGAGLGLAAGGGVRPGLVAVAARPPRPGPAQPLQAPRRPAERSTTVVLRTAAQ